MEYCSGGELFDKISANHKFTEEQVAMIIRQLVSAIAYCHANNIVHRDIKPENILLEDRNGEHFIKLADFGNSVVVDSNQPMRGCFGSAYYIAPEVLNGTFTDKCDI